MSEFPDWYHQALKKCETEPTLEAFKKGVQIGQTLNAPEPVIFIHDGFCEWKWSEFIFYTFHDRDTIFLKLSKSGFKPTSLDQISDIV